MKFHLIAVLIISSCYLVNAQDNYSGKYFVQTLMVEKAFPCYQIEYCVLRFSKKYIEVSYPVKTYCNTAELSKKHNVYNLKSTKKYQWKIIKGKLHIPEFENFNLSTFYVKGLDFIDDLYNKPKQKIGRN